MSTTLCEKCFPEWGDHGVITTSFHADCAQCGARGTTLHTFPSDPRLNVEPLQPLHGAPVGTLGLPQWKCHKVVGAAKILQINLADMPGKICTLDLDTVRDGDAMAFFSVDVDVAWIIKHAPKVGGYYVEYEDGYTSFSQADAFEKGYTPL